MRQPPTIVYLIENLGVGGIETVLWGLLRALPPERYRILPWFLADAGPSFERLRAVFPSTRFLHLRTYHRPGPLVALARELRAARADLIHAHGYFAGTFGRLVAPWLRLPWVYTMYSHYEDTYRARNYWGERLLARSRGVVVACSAAVRRFAVQRCGVAPDRVTVVYNGVDVPPESLGLTQADARAMLQLPAEAVVIGTVARLYPGKNVQHLLRAADTLPASCHLLIVGDGPERPALEQLAQTCGIRSRVHFTGSLQEAAPAYCAMDLFVQSSHLREGFSTALLEAMAFARPVVATAVGGNVEAVTEATGWLVPPDDVAALREVLLRVVTDREALARVGQAGRTRYLQLFTAGHMAHGIEAVYERLLGVS